MIEFFVAGQPATQGSKRPIAFRGKDGALKARVVDSSGAKLTCWRALIVDAALAAYTGPPMQGPLMLQLEFNVIRPKSHYGTGRNANVLKDSAPKYPITRPDSVKLARAVEDALTGVLWIDDSQVVWHRIEKIYSERAGVWVGVGDYT